MQKGQVHFDSIFKMGLLYAPEVPFRHPWAVLLHKDWKDHEKMLGKLIQIDKLFFPFRYKM